MPPKRGTLDACDNISLYTRKIANKSAKSCPHKNSYRLHYAAKQLVAKRLCGETTILQLYPCVCVYVEGGNRRVHTSHLPYHAFLASALINHFQLMSLFYSHFPPSFISQLLLFSLPYPLFPQAPNPLSSTTSMWVPIPHLARRLFIYDNNFCWIST